MTVLRNLFAVVALVSIPLVATAQASDQRLVFSAEDDTVTSFADLPSAALKLLVADREDFPQPPPANFRCTPREQSSPDFPNATILCRTLPLSNATGEDYLVIGVGGMRGAHIVPFWILHCEGTTATLLFKTRSDQIEILAKKFNGYREIQCTWIVGAGSTIRTTRLRFNGKRYVQFASHEDHN